MENIKLVYRAQTLSNPDTCIETACGSWQKAQKDIQYACVSILMALYQHRDADTATKRVNTLVTGVKGVNTTAVEEWFVQMGFKFDKEGVKSCPNRETIAQKAGNGFKDAKDLHWWTLKAIKPYAGHDLVAKLHGLISQTEKALKAGEEDGERAALDNIPTELLEYLKAAPKAA